MSKKNKVLKNNIFKDNNFEYDKKFSRVSKLHKYWSRKPWYIVREYINTYSKEGQEVLDPFCGSGIIGLESILANRNFCGYDLNPFAIFLAKTTLNTNFDINVLQDAFSKLELKISSEILKYYQYEKNEYILYTISGFKKPDNYNAVVSNKLFKGKRQLKVSKKYLDPKIQDLGNYAYPDKDFPKEFYKDRFSYKGISKVSDMFTKRNLRSLAVLNKAISEIDPELRDVFKLAFTNTLLHVSKLKSEGVRPLGVNNYWVPDDHIEENVWWRYKERFSNVLSALDVIQERSVGSEIGKYQLNNESSLKLKRIKNESIDYIFTDPPYGDTIQYSELSYIWNCWLGVDFEIEEEVIINPKQKKGIHEYSGQLESFVSEMDRVLKENSYFTLAFQNKDVRIWIILAEHIYSHQMKIVDISSYAVLGSPYNKNWAKFSPKSDFYVTFRKTGKKNVQKKRYMEFYPEEIASEVLLDIKEVDLDVFDLNKAYDLFIAKVLEKIFKGEIPGDDIKNLNVKKIIKIFEDLTK